MFSGPQIVEDFKAAGVSHVVWLPDSTLGQWDEALRTAPSLRLLRVCREGEAWTIAAGLHLAGARPMVVLQSTGLFESGDALRNVYFDLQLPIPALVGYRSFLLPHSTDSAKRFCEPILRAWQLDYRLIERPEQRPAMVEHWRECAARRVPGVVLLAEGKG